MQLLTGESGDRAVLAGASRFGKNLAPRATARRDAAAVSDVVAIQAPAAAPDLARSHVVGRELSKSQRPELGGAAIVVSGGRRPGSDDRRRRLLEPLADTLGTALGGSGRSRCRLRAQRLPPSTRGTRSSRRAVTSRRQFRSHPAPGGQEELQSDRGNQQGSGCVDLPGRGLRPDGRFVRRRGGVLLEPFDDLKERAVRAVGLKFKGKGFEQDRT